MSLANGIEEYFLEEFMLSHMRTTSNNDKENASEEIRAIVPGQNLF
jgi:hypothetical protein